MRMTIDDSERYLRLMLGGMKYAVKYWEDRDKEESDIEQTNVEAVEIALDIMRKYQKIQEIVRWNNAPSPYYKPDGQLFREICEVLEDGNIN